MVSDDDIAAEDGCSAAPFSLLLQAMKSAEAARMVISDAFMAVDFRCAC
jgi:hypothetical protein